MSVEFKLEGLEPVQEKFKRLGNARLIKNAARRSMRKAMAIVRDAARANAKGIDDPETAEKIWKNIAIAAGKTRNSNEVVMRVGVRGGAAQNANTDRAALSKLSGGITTYWRYLEFGSANMPATPFMRPALSNNISQVTNQFATSFNQEIEKELAKL
ncbi:HK97 gp10 family phage protein [Acinetobacter radioresistens]|uniref:HK97-gp10 family putative phage morphogenesis protein n=1 Tax=Acinetobacter radioresistens TaxID=40216 RepID=UPI0021CDE76B|nr:HK97-gp10 family putative phage morphogenesis protein [Acinetobacter radioresistens]MCU4310009.1 HK97 gp10 family phage protein [Acinetobacter radioresistens]